jgi:hypothetical protein
MVLFYPWYAKKLIKSKKRGKTNYYLIKFVFFQMNITFHVNIMVKYKWRRGLREKMCGGVKM